MQFASVASRRRPRAKRSRIKLKLSCLQIPARSDQLCSFPSVSVSPVFYPIVAMSLIIAPRLLDLVL